MGDGLRDCTTDLGLSPASPSDLFGNLGQVPQPPFLSHKMNVTGVPVTWSVTLTVHAVPGALRVLSAVAALLKMPQALA